MKTIVQEDFVYYEPQSIDMPSRNHSLVQSNLVVALNKYSSEYQAFSQLTIELDKVQYIPDVCLYPQKSYQRGFDELAFTTPPLVVFEIVSPKQGTQELIEKFAIYFQAGVKSCWLIQPLLPLISIYTDATHSNHYTSETVKDHATPIEVSFEEMFRFLV
jgi:Uma2 family endonuclease